MNTPNQQLTKKSAIGYGLLFVAAGLYCIFKGLHTAAGNQVPGWIIICVGIAFFLGAAAIYNSFLITRDSQPGYSQKKFFQYLLVLLLVSLLDFLSGWIAFGPGQRSFTEGPELAQTPISSPSGRILFGIGFVIVFLIVIYLLRATINYYKTKTGN